MIIKHFIKSVVWALFIIVVCTINVESSKEINPIFNILPIDKAFHGFIYFVFVILLLSEKHKQTNNIKKSIIFALIISSLYGIMIELLQHFLFHFRSGELLDVIFNLIGIVTGIIIYYWLQYIRT